MKSIRSKLTYANVIATLALFIAIGGASAFAASKLGKNSVGTKQIKNGYVTGIKIKKGTITGTNINLATLGTVPSATNASSATTATTAGTANALAPPEAIRFVGAPGQPPFLGGSSNIGTAESFNYTPAGFYKDHDGIVHLEGVVNVGKESENEGSIFQLPPGYRPASGATQAFRSGEDLFYVFGSNVTIEGHNLEGDVYSQEQEGQIINGITFRAQS